ncbi:hypothetical protein OROHE_025362 [Orobanche hederae]
MAPSPTPELHFVLVPLLAQGHMIPMIDMAKLLAGHGVTTSLVTTPHNTARFSETIRRARASGLHIQLIEIPFPSQEVGLPPGCENLDSVPSRDLLRNFYCALDKLQEPLEQYLQAHGPPPSCIISDRPHVSVGSDSEPFVIPGMPVDVEITKAQLPGSFVALPDLDDIRNQMQEAESNAYGVVVNTFSELEAGCAEEYRKAVNKKIWCIGPVSLCNRETRDKFERGDRASIGETKCLEWLDSKKPKSVLYACLGSQCRLVPAQLIQLGLGPEESKHPFIRVIKTGVAGSQELENWLADEKFEERIRGRGGLLIKGWAPQALVLSHPAVGGVPNTLRLEFNDRSRLLRGAYDHLAHVCRAILEREANR